MKISSKNFYLHLYGRHKGVTGSCFLGSVHFPNKKNLRFLVDCGNFQGNDNLGYLDLNEVIPFDTQKIDFVLVTHNHIDHIVLLPLLIRQGYKGPIYITKPGYGLIDIPLNEAWKVNCKGKINPSYEQDDVNSVLKQLRGISFNQRISPKKNVEITFFKNGHLVGASLIEIVFTYPGEKDIRLLFTGDFHYKNLFFDVEKMPVENRKNPYSLVICESTYGDMDSTDEKCKPILVNRISQAIKEDKKVIIPTFAMGRTQEVAYYLKSMQDQELLPKDVEIWQGGTSAREITYRFMYNNLGLNPEMRRFLPKNYHFVLTKERNQVCENLLNSAKPSVIISPGGMASYGTVKTFINKAIEQDDVLIIFPGYCSRDSKGYELINTPKGSKIQYGGYTQTLNCDVTVSGEISAHAKRDDLLSFLKNMAEPKSILINHGETDVKLKFSNYLRDKFSPKTKIEVFNPDYAYSIDSNGIFDIYASSFQLF